MHRVAGWTLGSPWWARPCFWRQHSKVECLCLHSNVPAHSEWVESFGTPCVLEPLTTPCLLLRTEMLSCLVFQVACGSVLQWECNCLFSPTRGLWWPWAVQRCPWSAEQIVPLSTRHWVPTSSPPSLVCCSQHKSYFCYAQHFQNKNYVSMRNSHCPWL